MFKPMLAPNDKVELTDIEYPQLASFKIDGLRCIFKDGVMFTRSLKSVPNKQLHKRFYILRSIVKLIM